MGQSVSRTKSTVAVKHQADAIEKTASAERQVDDYWLHAKPVLSSSGARGDSSLASMPQAEKSLTPPQPVAPLDHRVGSSTSYGTGAEAFLPPMQRQTTYERDVKALVEESRRQFDNAMARVTPEEWQALERRSEVLMQQSHMFSVDGAGQQRRRQQRRTWWQALTGK